MRLRSGRVYSARYQYRHSLRRINILETIKEEKMAPTTTTTPVTPVTTVTTSSPTPTTTTTASGSGAPRFTIVTHSSITPFAGYVSGKLTQSVESFISSVNAHLVAKHITDDKLQYLEARSFLDLSKGDCGEWARSLVFRCADTWTELKSLLRKAYSQDVSDDMVQFLRTIIRDVQDRRSRTVVKVAAEVSDKLLEFTDKLRHTGWVKGRDVDGEEYMTLSRVMLLLQLSLVTTSLPDRLVALFDEPLDTDATEITIIEQIRKHLPKLPDGDPTILTPTGNEKRSGQVTSAAVGSYRQNSRGFQPQASSQQQNRMTCRNCGKAGHIMKECNARFCVIHNTDRHAYKNCRARQGNAGNSNRSSGNRSTGSQSSYSNRNRQDNFRKKQSKSSTVSSTQESTGGRSRSGNGSNFQSNQPVNTSP